MALDVEQLMREHRPAADPAAHDADSPHARAALERILADPGPLPPRRGRRRRRRAIVLATGTGALALAIVAGAPMLRDAPDVVARAAAALGDDDTILYFHTEARVRNTWPEWRSDRPDDHVDGRTQVWQTAGGRQIRRVMGRAEMVEDWDAKTAQSWNAESNTLITHTEPDLFRNETRPRELDHPGFTEGDVIGDLAALLERARRGENDLRVVGETTVRGVPVYELRLDYRARQGRAIRFPEAEAKEPRPPADLKLSRTIYVDRERYLPVRVVERGPGSYTQAIVDFRDVQRLPRTPENEALLKMSPHPGAKHEVEGRF